MVIIHFYKIKQTDIEIIMSRKNDQNKRTRFDKKSRIKKFYRVQFLTSSFFIEK